MTIKGESFERRVFKNLIDLEVITGFGGRKMLKV